MATRALAAWADDMVNSTENAPLQLARLCAGEQIASLSEDMIRTLFLFVDAAEFTMVPGMIVLAVSAAAAN
jgi:hypothetical protein